MRVLRSVSPSREQLPMVLNDRPGIAVIRGAAGSGKTTTALLRLKQLCEVRRARRVRLGEVAPVHVLVLTFNRSLAGYVAALAEEQVRRGVDLDLTVSTFAKWAFDVTGISVMSDDLRRRQLQQLATGLRLEDHFLFDEIDYVFGRFPSSALGDYLSRDRDGRGVSPRVDKTRLLNEVVLPYQTYKLSNDLQDWHDLTEAAELVTTPLYDIIVVDEAQDFSANQIRAVLAHRADDASVTFVLDTVQRIYPRFYTWRELGLDANRFALNSRLKENRRNTKQIAAFARPFVEGLLVDENGELPDLESATDEGPLPKVFGGIFSEQSDVIVDYIKTVDLARESIGILHPLGGGWFDHLRGRLSREGIVFVELAKNREWPRGPTNVGLSTLHSAKGLEFDHVIVCGVTGRTAYAVADEDDTDRQNLRRLLAMGFGRARVGLLLCHDPSAPASVLEYLDPATYDDLNATT